MAGRHKRGNRRPGSWTSSSWRILGGGVLIALAFAAVVILFFIRPPAIQRDEVTLCPVAGPSAITAVLIDRTDSIGAISRTDLFTKVNDIIERTLEAEAVELYVVNAVETAPLSAVIKVCNPGKPAQDEAWDEGWATNPRIMRLRWTERFKKPLNRLLSDLLTMEEAESSPIMESVQSLSVTVFAGNDKANLPKRLIIASDLLQNSSAWSLYKQPSDFRRFAGSSGAKSVAGDLRDVSVQLLFIQRKLKRPIPELDLVTFWVKWIESRQGRVERIVKITGLNE